MYEEDVKPISEADYKTIGSSRKPEQAPAHSHQRARSPSPNKHESSSSSSASKKRAVDVSEHIMCRDILI